MKNLTERVEVRCESPSSTGAGVSYRLIVEMEVVAVNKGLLINEGVCRRRSLLEPVRRDVPINTALPN